MNILRFVSAAAWVNGITAFFADRLWQNPQLRICLPAGKTPTPVYAGIGQAVQAGQISFQRATVFTLDEFGSLAPDDPGRCVNMLRRDLLENIDLPEKQFWTIDPDRNDLDSVCRAYDRAIGPGFDLCVLGLGLNGHLGMNEPGSPEDSLTRRVDLASQTIASSARYLNHSNLPRWGVTVGLKQILDSKEVWLIANGSGKAEIIYALLNGPVSTEIPASLLRRHPSCYLFADAAAASQIF